MESSETLLGITLSSSGGFWSKGWADIRRGRVYVFSMAWVAGGMKRQVLHFTVACVYSTRAYSHSNVQNWLFHEARGLDNS